MATTARTQTGMPSTGARKMSGRGEKGAVYEDRGRPGPVKSMDAVMLWGVCVAPRLCVEWAKPEDVRTGLGNGCGSGSWRFPSWRSHPASGVGRRGSGRALHFGALPSSVPAQVRSRARRGGSHCTLRRQHRARPSDTQRDPMRYGIRGGGKWHGQITECRASEPPLRIVESVHARAGWCC